MQKLLTDNDYDTDAETVDSDVEENKESTGIADNVVIPSLTPQQFLDKKQRLREQYQSDPEIKKNKKNRNKGLNIFERK